MQSAKKGVVVLKVGGSVAFPGKPDPEVINKLVEYINQFKSQGKRVAVIVGGGKLVRDYVSALRGTGMNEAFLDELGILIGRLNARVVAKMADGRFVETLEQARYVVEEGIVPVMGGMIPGQSHDAVAAVVAEYLEAEHLYILTDVGGVYDKDPKISSDARLLPNLSFSEMIRLCEGLESKAGNYPIFDFVAAKVISRSKIRTTLCKFENLTLATEGKSGTLVDG
ncbi:MAG: UMP kinase [archaeon]